MNFKGFKSLGWCEFLFSMNLMEIVLEVPRQCQDTGLGTGFHFGLWLQGRLHRYVGIARCKLGWFFLLLLEFAQESRKVASRPIGLTREALTRRYVAATRRCKINKQIRYRDTFSQHQIHRLLAWLHEMWKGRGEDELPLPLSKKGCPSLWSYIISTRD